MSKALGMDALRTFRPHKLLKPGQTKRLRSAQVYSQATASPSQTKVITLQVKELTSESFRPFGQAIHSQGVQHDDFDV